MTKDVYRIEIISSGPDGLSAAAHATEMGVSHILIEGESHVSNTIFRYQKGTTIESALVVSNSTCDVINSTCSIIPNFG